MMEMINSLVYRLQRVDRRVGLAVAGIVPLLLIGGAVVLFSGGGDEEPELSPEDAALLQEAMFSESEVDIRVAATIEAIPTPEPTPTPDIAATVAAERATSRGEVAPEIRMSQLEARGGVLNPYLTADERRYLVDVGKRVWYYVKVWVHLREVTGVDISGWDAGDFQYQLSEAQLVLEAAPQLPQGDSDISDVVRDYVRELDDGMKEVREAVVRLSDAEPLFAESGEIPHGNYEDVQKILRDVGNHLEKFDAAMSRYGCSICGELFRLELN